VAKKVPVTVYVDPDVESTITIKPFAGALATRLQPTAVGVAPNVQPDGWTGTGTVTGVGSPNPDGDVDVDYS